MSLSKRRKTETGLDAREVEATKVQQRLDELRRRVGQLEQVETVITVKTVRKR